MAKMAKSKINKKLKAENPNYLIVTALLVGILALLQNKYGLLSDVRSFYGLHFYDGQHLWPFSEKTLLGETKVQHPVEYPALTGLIM